MITLREHFPEAGLTPQPGQPERSTFLFWLSLMATAGYLTVARKAHPERYASEDAAIAQVESRAARDLDAFFDVMEGAVAGDAAFLESGYSALDLYLAMLIEMSDDKGALFVSRPVLAGLCDAVSERQAYRASMQTHQLN